MLLFHLSKITPAVKRITVSTVMALAIAFFCISNGNAATISASSCSLDEVKAAIYQASAGDTVVVPSGNCIWGSSVTIPTGVTLQGAGIGETIITRSNLEVAVILGGNNSRLTGFEFVSAGLRVNRAHYWRIDHCKISDASGGVGIRAQGDSNSDIPGGVIDNCEFVNVSVRSSNDLESNLYTDALWYKPLNLGSTENIIYVEDCIFNITTYMNTTDTSRSGQLVIRYSTTTAWFEVHGARNDYRGTRRWEIYRNTINHDSNSPSNTIMNIRGGTGVIFDNTATSTRSDGHWVFGMERASTSYTYSGKCDGNSAWDSKEDGTGWLCRDQVGAGPDTRLGPGVQTLPPYAQTKVPAYIWGNTWNGRAPNFRAGPKQVKEKRDWYIDASSASGVTGGGVTFGTLASRPATCTIGVAYWATDQGNWNKKAGGQQGVLYKCTAPNTWKLYYTPYTYPHPLRQTGKGQPPQNLRIIH